MKVRGWLAPSALAIVIALAGCSRADPSIIAAAPDNTTGGGTTNTGGPTSLEVAADPGGGLKFAQETLSGAADSPLTVKFNNPAPLPHNWVLVKPGTEQAVADATKGTGGDPTGVADVIAGFAPLTNGEATAEVPAQPAGDYPYICTVPGHYEGGMKGTLTLGAPAANAGGGGEAGGASAPADAGAGASGAAGGNQGGGGSPSVAADPAALKFAQETMEVPAGGEITVNFTNPAPLPHNWVLVEPGQEQAVAEAALPKGGDPTGITGVIAGGKPITSGGEPVTVPALQPGEYPYICTVPGHYQAGMKGTLAAK